MRGLDPRMPTGTAAAQATAAGFDSAGGDGRVKPGHDEKRAVS
jgi:hypothetical protein